MKIIFVQLKYKIAIFNDFFLTNLVIEIINADKNYTMSFKAAN